MQGKEKWWERSWCSAMLRFGQSKPWLLVPGPILRGQIMLEQQITPLQPVVTKNTVQMVEGRGSRVLNQHQEAPNQGIQCEGAVSFGRLMAQAF